MFLCKDDNLISGIRVTLVHLNFLFVILIVVALEFYKVVDSLSAL